MMTSGIRRLRDNVKTLIHHPALNHVLLIKEEVEKISSDLNDLNVSKSFVVSTSQRSE
jgi:hypothetical protein